MPLKLTNNATSRLATSLSNVDTAVVLAAGDGDKFPTLAAGDWFPVTVVRADAQREVMYASARAGDVLTVSRGREGTPALSFAANDRVELRATAGVFASYLPLDGGTMTGDLSVSGSFAAADVSASGSIQQRGEQVWHAGNFDPATKANLSGAEFSGKVAARGVNGAMASDDQTSVLEVANASGGTGDTGMAVAAFSCQGQYGIKLGLRADGYFGLGGWSSAAWRWYSDANGNMVASGDVSAYSDPRLKDDVEPIAHAMDIVRALDGVRFTWNDRTRLIGKPGVRDIGVLADQVESVLPEIVGRSIPDAENNGEQWRVVAYDKLTPVLIQAIKELDARMLAMGG